MKTLRKYNDRVFNPLRTTKPRGVSFVVVTPIVRHGVMRDAGFVFEAGEDGVHVQRWLARGAIRRAQEGGVPS